MLLNGFEMDICEPFNELVIWRVSGFFVVRESSFVSFSKKNLCFPLINGVVIQQHRIIYIPCSNFITLSEHFWRRFILTGNNRTTQACCLIRVLMGGILLNQISKNGLKRGCNQQLNVEPVLPACSNMKQDLD